MTGKSSKNQANSSSQYSKFENEISKLRNENKWLRLRDISGTIPLKDAKFEILAKFCIAESDLENYLFSNPLIFSNTTDLAANTNPTSSNNRSNVLYEVELMLKDVISKADHNSIHIEACALLSKLFYSQMRYEEALKQLSSNKIQSAMNEHISQLKVIQQQQQQSNTQIGRTDSMRQLQIFAEAHSIKALCLENKRSIQINANPSYKNTDEYKRDDQDIIDAYEIASLFAIQHSIQMHNLMSNTSVSPSNTTVAIMASAVMQNNPSISTSQNQAQTSVQNSSSAGSNANTITGSSSSDANTALNLNALNNAEDNLDLINPLYEIALQKAPLLYIKKGELQMGMKKFRDLLQKKNIQSIASIRQILLKKFSECLMFNIPSSSYTLLKLTSNEDKQKSLFKPVNQDEEILLCLTLSQYLASKEVMLFRQAQFKQIREYTFNNAVNSLDLLLIYLAYHRSYNVLLDKFEMTAKYSFENFYLWYQHGLTLVCDQKYYKAYLVLKECSRMNPTHVACHLLLARLALENLFLVSEAIDWCNKVLEMTNKKNKKAYILLGSSMVIKAKLQKQHAVQINYYDQAMDSFKKATTLDPFDYLPLYHIAHCYAILRQVNEAIDYVQKSLKLRPDDKDSLHLLALLLTSTKNFDEANTVISKACVLYDDFELLFTKIRIEEILYGFNHSISSLVNLILVYKQKIQQCPNDPSGSTASSSAFSVIQPGVIINTANRNAAAANQNDSWSNFESASLLNLQHTYKLNEAIGKTVTMLVQSDQLALKYGGSALQSQNMQQILILVRILTQIGEFYLRHDKLADAEACCQEIASIHPMSYLYIYLRGRIFEYKQEFLQAKLCYQNALSINPHHIQSLQQMSLVLCQMQNFHLAEKMIRDAISLNSSLPDSWHILARVLDYQNDSQSALKCYQTCLQLEATNPIIPFSSLTRIL